MLKTIDDVIARIRYTIPHSDSIKEFKKDDAGHYVRFSWNAKEFLVKKSLEVFELKNNTLFVTGASMLMQSALASEEKRDKTLEACAVVLKEAEDLISTRRQLEKGLELLNRVKATVASLGGRRIRSDASRMEKARWAGGMSLSS